MNKLKYFIFCAENSGVGYYRQYLPAVVLRETGLAEVRINDFRWGVGDHVNPTEKVFFETCNWADVIIVGRMDVRDYYAKWAAAKEFFNIPIIMDTDDNVHFVPPSNPGYQGYNPASEARFINQYAMEKIFDALTVTTKDLQKFYKPLHPRIYVLPNNLDVTEWLKHSRQPHDDEIRMCFLCSGAHWEGFGIIQKSVYDILKKYKNVFFYYPEMYWRVFQNVPEEIKGQMRSIPWIKLQDWPKGLTELSIDIGLAPLKDNNFNRSKSNLRYLEYSISGMATIVSPISPYLCVNNQIDGVLAKEQEEWYNAIEKLILDKHYRNLIATNAKNRIIQEFNIWSNISKWDEVYREVHEKYHSFYGAKKVFKDIGKGKYQQIDWVL